MITVQVNRKSNEVDIYCDTEGAESLIQRLNFILTHGGHEHLMTPSWAGDDLSEEPIGNGDEIVNHLRIVLLPSNAESSR